MSGGGGEMSASSEITWGNVWAPSALPLGETGMMGRGHHQWALGWLQEENGQPHTPGGNWGNLEERQHSLLRSGVPDGGNLLQAAPAETRTKVQPVGFQAPQQRSGEVWGGAGSWEMLVEGHGVMFTHQAELNRAGSVHWFSCTSLHWLSQISPINATPLWCWETSIMEIKCSAWTDEWKLHNPCPISEKHSNVEWVQPNLIAVIKTKERTSIQEATRRKARTWECCTTRAALDSHQQQQLQCWNNAPASELWQAAKALTKHLKRLMQIHIARPINGLSLPVCTSLFCASEL